MSGYVYVADDGDHWLPGQEVELLEAFDLVADTDGNWRENNSDPERNNLQMGTTEQAIRQLLSDGRLYLEPVNTDPAFIVDTQAEREWLEASMDAFLRRCGVTVP